MAGLSRGSGTSPFQPVPRVDFYYNSVAVDPANFIHGLTMFRTLLKSKIHRATVTEANLNYAGSITIDRSLMDAANLVDHERVEIYNITNGSRLATYVIPGAADSGVIGINGAAAHLVRPGHLVIIASYAQYAEDTCQSHQPIVLQVDEANCGVVGNSV